MARIERNSWEKFLRSRHGIIGSRDRVSRLPEGVLQHVISFLPSSEQDQVRLLSRTWRRLNAQNKRLLYLYGCRLNEQELVRVLEDDFHSAESMILKKCPGMKNLKIVNFKLKNIELNYCGSLKNLGINTPSLETFYFYGPRVRPCVIEFSNCTQLRTMHLVGVAINNMMFMNSHSFPVLQVLTLSGCDTKSCINISSHSIRTLHLMNFKKSVEITIDTPNLLCFMYTGSTIVPFLNMNCPRLLSAQIELNPNRYQKRDEVWFRRLNQLLQGLKHATRVEFDTNSDKSIIIPKRLRESLVPPLDTICNMIKVRTRSRSNDAVELADAMLWICPRVKELDLFYFGVVLKLDHGELSEKQQAISCCFCTSHPSRCWRHSVTQFEIEDHNDKESGKNLMSYLTENLKEVGNKAVGMFRLRLTNLP